MSESGEKKSFWARIFGGSTTSAREEKVLDYIVHRMSEDANLHDIVEEEYVKRNATRSQIDDILSNPRIIEAAHERLQDAFASGELDPNKRPE